jgi:hypothetical protein
MSGELMNRPMIDRDKFRYAECPICSVRIDSEAKYIANILFEHVADPLVRIQFINSLGYCHEHAWQQQQWAWSTRRDGGGVAIMYENVLYDNLGGLDVLMGLTQFKLKLSRLPIVRRLWRVNGHRRTENDLYWPFGLRPLERCAVCDRGDHSERYHLKRLIGTSQSAGSDEIDRAVGDLCWPHLNQSLALLDEPDGCRDWLDVALQKFTATRQRLRERLDQPNHSAAELKRVTHRAMSQLVGHQPWSPASISGHAPPTMIDQHAADVADLDEALAHDACPICLLTAVSGRRFIDRFLNDYRIDTQVRNQFAQDQQLCYCHTWQIYGNDAVFDAHLLTLTTIALDSIESLSDTLKSFDPERLAHVSLRENRSRLMFRRSKRRPALEGQRLLAVNLNRPCPICAAEAAALDHSLADLLRRLAQPDFRQNYELARGLCLPHLRAAIVRSSRLEDLLFLTTTASYRLEQLIHWLQEYDRKHIWNYRNEPKLPEEQAAWIRAVAFEAGEYNWANDQHRGSSL